MAPGTPDNKVTKVQINLYASKLKNVAGLGRGTSDPFAVVTLLSNDPMEKPRILGKTEVYVSCIVCVRIQLHSELLAG